MQSHYRYCLAIALLFISETLQAAERFEFTRMIAHWDAYSTPDYLAFVDDAKPEIAQVGFYGGHFWSLAGTPHGKGYPAHFPVEGHRECAAWLAKLNAELHRRGVKVIGHFNVTMLVGDPESPEGPRGFFQSYRQWNAQQLGPRPVDDPLSLLEVDRDGKPISNDTYKIGGMREYWACLANPAWRAVLKAWLKFAVEQGVDGLVANYFYRHDCHCRHCVQGFRAYLQKRFSPQQLAEQFQISDLANHRFAEIGAWHDPKQSTPLRREALRFSQLSNKEAFDEVFVRYGRSIKPDLIVAQWNHLGDFNQIDGDERCLLPAEAWGRDEDYLWYSTGGAANSTDLAAGVLGEGTLQARYIRGAFDNKPFTLGKYEDTRVRVAIAELAANGGAPMGFYTRFTDPAAREQIVRYYAFLRRYEALFRGNEPHAEVRLLFPRSKVHRGDVAGVARFKEIGRALLDAHVLFDVVPDDVKDARVAPHMIDPGDPDETAQSAIGRLPPARSQFTAPPSVRASANRSAKRSVRSRSEITLHLVNYNREEPEKGRASGGVKDDKPIAVPQVGVRFRLPPGTDPRRVEFISPETPEPVPVPFQHAEGAVSFQTPEFLVYGIARIELEPLP